MAEIYLDSTCDELAVGVCKDRNSNLLFTVYKCWQAQSEHMLPELEKLFLKGNLDKKSIEKVYVSIGPGSYTGVRIALTIAKTIAVALNAEVYPVSSLQILQEKDKKSICLMDARSGRSFFAVYENEKAIIEDQIMSNKEIKAYISSHPDYSVCGYAKQLGIDVDCKHNNIIENMHRLRDSYSKIDNALALKPIYMKG